MTVAGVTLTYNDGYKFDEWIRNYEEYKQDLNYFIVVDNGSDPEYLKCVRNYFTETNTVLIERGSNGGCTGAYNDGIKYALDNTDSDAIIIIGNDVRLCEDFIPKLYKYLYSDDSLGIVSSVMLVKDSYVVEDFGHKLMGLDVLCLESGKNYYELPREEKYTDLVAGGINMAKREFYEKVGFQDETLFMYGDEIDISYRARRAGYHIGITSKIYNWHWHISETDTGDRKPASNYLIARNRVYLSKKYFGGWYVWHTFFRFSLSKAFKQFVSGILFQKKDRLEKAKYTIMGGINGLKGNMELNKYTLFK